MKNYIASTIAATGLIVFIFGMECSAQNVRRLVADIPFDFYVGEQRLPSGSYEFELTMPQATAGALIVRSTTRSARSSFIVPTLAEATNTGDEPMLRFNRYGSEHFLSRVNLAGDGARFKIRKTSREKRVAKELHLEALPISVRQSVAAAR